jgi:hypothetical protein
VVHPLDVAVVEAVGLEEDDPGREDGDAPKDLGRRVVFAEIRRGKDQRCGKAGDVR